MNPHLGVSLFNADTLTQDQIIKNITYVSITHISHFRNIVNYYLICLIFYSDSCELTVSYCPLTASMLSYDTQVSLM